MLRSLRSAYNTLAVLLIVFAQSAYAETFEGPVVRVVDGDSLIVLRGTKQVRVRLKEIDAPEHNQRFGKRSRQSSTDMCAKKRARVSWRETDRNGRTLGRVWCAGVDANAEQVRRGMAWVFNRYDRSLYPLQEAARSDRLGLWADAEPIAPWEWRAAKGQLEYRAKK
jgi:endonuclease YncB( thermonuclease family)